MWIKINDLVTIFLDSGLRSEYIDLEKTLEPPGRTQAARANQIA